MEAGPWDVSSTSEAAGAHAAGGTRAAVCAPAHPAGTAAGAHAEATDAADADAATTDAAAAATASTIVWATECRPVFLVCSSMSTQVVDDGIGV